MLADPLSTVVAVVNTRSVGVIVGVTVGDGGDWVGVSWIASSIDGRSNVRVI